MPISLKLRRLFTIAVTALIAGTLVSTIVPASAAPAPLTSSVVADLAALVNQNRVALGLQPLELSYAFDDIAQEWVDTIVSTGVYEHSTDLWRDTRTEPIGVYTSGEALAYGQTSAAQVMTAWMNSPEHRAILMRADRTTFGIGYATGPGGPFWAIQTGYNTTHLRAGSTPFFSTPPVVGQPLNTGSFNWPAGTVVNWRWLANGNPIPGANSATYWPTAEVLGMQLTAVATGTLNDQWFATSVRSTPTAPVTGPVAPVITVSRLSGPDRFATAVEITKEWEPGVPVLYIANGLNFPDALSAAPAAATRDSPLLLTLPGSLPAVVRSEVARLNPARIIVVGGPASITPGVLAQLQTYAPTSRVSGSDRYSTSRAVVREAFTSSPIAYIATGTNFPDALSAGAVAGALDAPVILLYGGATTVDPATVALLRDLGVTTVRIAGGPSSVSTGIEASIRALGLTVERVAGTDRFITSALINDQVYDTATDVYVANGLNFPDALAGAVLAGRQGAPLVISQQNCLSVPAANLISALAPRRVVLLGGEASLSPAVKALTRC